MYIFNYKVILVLFINILCVHTYYIESEDNKPTFNAYNSINGNNIIILERKVNNFLKILDLSNKYKIVFQGSNKPIETYIAQHTGVYSVVSNLNTYININVTYIMKYNNFNDSDIIIDNLQTIRFKNNISSKYLYYIEIILKNNCSNTEIIFPHEYNDLLKTYKSTNVYSKFQIAEIYNRIRYCVDLIFLQKNITNIVLFSIIDFSKVPIYYYTANQFCNLCYETIDNITPPLYSFQTYLGQRGINFDKYSKYTNNIDGEDVVIHWIDGGYIKHEDINDEDITYITKNNKHKNFLNLNHGIASLGIMKAIRNNIGITGIASKAKIMVYDVLSFNEIFKYIKPGDIVGINCGFDIYNKTTNETIEYPITLYRYMKYRINKLINNGVIVVAAAGNGNNNMSADNYDNVYVKNLILAGAIDINKEKAYYSNYNHPNLIASTMSNNLITLGFGDLYYNFITQSNYTSIYTGTSASTPIITAVIASLQSYVKKHFNKILIAEDVVNLIKTNTVKTESVGYVIDMVNMLDHIKSKNFYNKYMHI